jgi:hypothetical protein
VTDETDTLEKQKIAKGPPVFERSAFSGPPPSRQLFNLTQVIR